MVWVGTSVISAVEFSLLCQRRVLDKARLGGTRIADSLDQGANQWNRIDGFGSFTYHSQEAPDKEATE